MKTTNFIIQRYGENRIKVNGEMIHRDFEVGGCTHIFFYGKYVIKMDVEKSGEGGLYYNQCERTIDNWDIVKDTPFAKFFAPLLDWGVSGGYTYVVQKRVTGDSRGHSIRTYNCEGLKEGVCDALRFLGLTDIHSENYKVNNNFPVIFDYAL